VAVFLLFGLNGRAPAHAGELLPADAIDPGACSLRLDIEGVGTVLACPPAGEAEGNASRLLWQKPGGMVEVIHSVEGMAFVNLLRGDLDGDSSPELVAVARHPSSEDQVPFIFSERRQFACLYPRDDEEEMSLVGLEITLVPAKEGTALCIRNRVDFHRLGPPDLFQSELYRLVGDRLQKIGETLSAATHVHQKMNRAALAFQRGEFLEALRGYEAIPLAELPREAQAEALFNQAEARKYLKDFATADRLYGRLQREFADSPLAEAARRESERLAFRETASAALGLYVDASLLVSRAQWEQALALLNAYLATQPTGPLADHLLLLKGEALIALGRTEEALATLRALLAGFPDSPVRQEAAQHLEELAGDPEESEAPAAGDR
jgi:tetratricopeptide (TPR) repeat protein